MRNPNISNRKRNSFVSRTALSLCHASRINDFAQSDKMVRAYQIELEKYSSIGHLEPAANIMPGTVCAVSDEII
jgi:hypothetical protein